MGGFSVTELHATLAEALVEKDDARVVLTQTLQLVASDKNRDGEKVVAAWVEASAKDAVDVAGLVCGDTKDMKLSDADRATRLADLGLSALAKPVVVADISGDIAQMLASKSAVDKVDVQAIVQFIDLKLKKGDQTENLHAPVCNHVVAMCLPGAEKLQALAQFVPLLARVAQNDGEKVVLLKYMVEAWFEAKKTHGSKMQPLFAQLLECNVVSKENVQKWRDDLANKGKSKQAVIIECNTWISDLIPKQKTVWADDEEDEEDDGIEDIQN